MKKAYTLGRLLWTVWMDAVLRTICPTLFTSTVTSPRYHDRLLMRRMVRASLEPCFILVRISVLENMDYTINILNTIVSFKFAQVFCELFK